MKTGLQQTCSSLLQVVFKAVTSKVYLAVNGPLSLGLRGKLLSTAKHLKGAPTLMTS